MFFAALARFRATACVRACGLCSDLSICYYVLGLLVAFTTAAAVAVAAAGVAVAGDRRRHATYSVYSFA